MSLGEFYLRSLHIHNYLFSFQKHKASSHFFTFKAMYHCPSFCSDRTLNQQLTIYISVLFSIRDINMPKLLENSWFKEYVFSSLFLCFFVSWLTKDNDYNNCIFM